MFFRFPLVAAGIVWYYKAAVSYTHLDVYKRQAVENEVADNMYQRSELDYLIYNDPIGYADLVLNGNPEI